MKVKRTNNENIIKASSTLLADGDLLSMSPSCPGRKVVIEISDVEIQQRRGKQPFIARAFGAVVLPFTSGFRYIQPMSGINAADAGSLYRGAKGNDRLGRSF